MKFPSLPNGFIWHWIEHEDGKFSIYIKALELSTVEIPPGRRFSPDQILNSSFIERELEGVAKLLRGNIGYAEKIAKARDVLKEATNESSKTTP